MNTIGMNASLNRVLRSAAGAVLVCLMLAPKAEADTIRGETLVQRSVLVTGNLSSVYGFHLQSAGILTVRLENIAWPEQLSTLDCSIFATDGFVEALQGGAEFTYSTSGPGYYYANVLAGAKGALKLGLYSLKISFKPYGSPVPLPAAGWLLASVLGMLGIRRPARAAWKFAFGGRKFA